MILNEILYPCTTTKSSVICLFIYYFFDIMNKGCIAHFSYWFQEDVVKPLLEVTKTALLHDCTLLCAWR